MQSGGVNHITDEEIRNRLISHPEEGWRPFWERHGNFILRIIRRYHLKSEDSQEILQEVSLRLVKDNLRLLRSWDPGRGMLRGYLAVVTSSTCRSYLRSIYRHNDSVIFISRDDPNTDPLITSHLSDPSPGPMERLQQRDVATLLMECLDSWEKAGELKADDYQLLRWRLEGLDNAQIASRLGISPGNASIRYHRLKHALKDRLARSGLKAEDMLD